MAGIQIKVSVEDVNGSFARLIREAPKVLRSALSTAVFRGASSVKGAMESQAPSGPDGVGADPMEHIKSDIEIRKRGDSLMAEVGIFNDPEDVAVALFNEYSPNHQPFMRPAAERAAGAYLEQARAALQQFERYFG